MNDESLELVKQLIKAVSELSITDENKKEILKARSEAVIRKLYGENSPRLESLKKISFWPKITPCAKIHEIKCWEKGKEELVSLLNTILIEEELKTETTLKRDAAPLVILNMISERFYAVAKRLSSRYQNRPAIEIKDEHDINDILAAVLSLFFEEITPLKYTGFFLKKEGIAVEVELIKEKGEAGALEEKIIKRVSYHKQNRECKTIFYFIYAPGKDLFPPGIETCLNSSIGGLNVMAAISRAPQEN